MTAKLVVLLLLALSFGQSQQKDIAVIPDPTNDAFVWYEFKPLGIRFRSFAPFHDPFDLRSSGSLSVSGWKSFASPRDGVQFMYPPALMIRVVGETSDHPSDCGFTIQLVSPLIKHFENDSLVTTSVPVIEIYFTKEDFEQVAADEGFEFAAPEGVFYDDESPSATDSSTFRWIVLGRQGMQEDASVLDGGVWKGLRGENLTGLYSRQEGYLMSVPFVTSFLMCARGDGCNIVARFFEGPVSDAEDEFKPGVCEGEFYYLVSTMTALR